MIGDPEQFPPAEPEPTPPPPEKVIDAPNALPPEEPEEEAEEGEEDPNT